MPKLSEVLPILEKLTSFPFLMFITSLVLFIDLYLLCNHGITIRHINMEWTKAHATVGELLTFAVWFVVLYLFTFPLLHWFTGLVFSEIGSWLSSKINKLFGSENVSISHRYVSIITLRDFAVKNNNSVAYKVYENHIAALNSRERNREDMRRSCFAILMLTIVHLVSFFPFVYAELARLPESFRWLLLGLFCFVVYHAYHDRSATSIRDDYVYLPSFESPDKERIRH